MRLSPASLLVAGLLLLASPATIWSQSYTWTTIAGLAGTNTAGTVDGTNTSARFNGPRGIALDKAGSLYVTDSASHTIRKIMRVGLDFVVTKIAGLAGAPGAADGTNSEARFYQPFGIAVDGTTNVYVTDLRNSTIRRLIPLGTNWVVTTLAGQAGSVCSSKDGTNGSANFFDPAGLSLDSAGNLLETDASANTVRRLTPEGTNWVVTTLAGRADRSGNVDGTNGAASFLDPRGVVADAAGRLVVGSLNRIRLISSVGTNWVTSTVAGGSGSQTADGTNGTAGFNRPYGMDIDAGGNIYVADCFNHAIRKIAVIGTNWVVTTIGGVPGYYNSGSADGVGTNAQFRFPSDVAVDGQGTIYVADTSNHAIRMGRFAPSLQLSYAGDHVLLVWPAAASNFVLETSNVIGPAAVWTPVMDPVVLCGDSCMVTNRPDASATYFRLRR